MLIVLVFIYFMVLLVEESMGRVHLNVCLKNCCDILMFLHTVKGNSKPASVTIPLN